MGQQQLHPMGIGEILDVAIKLYRRNAWTLIRIVLVIVVPVTIVANLIQVSATPSNLNPQFGFSSFTSTSNNTVSGHDAVTLFVGILVALALTWVGSLVATGATFKALAGSFVGEQPEWRSSLGFAARRIHSLVWVSLLGGFLTIVGFILLIIPGIYLGIAFTVAVPALLSENLRGSKALARSRRLVKGRWWPTLGLVILGSLLAGVVNSALVGLAVGVAAEGANASTVLGFTVSTTASILAKAITTPFTAAYVTVLYFDLRVRREAFDLQLLALQVGVDPAEGGVRLSLNPPAGAPVCSPLGLDQPPFWPPPPGWQPGLSNPPGGGAVPPAPPGGSDQPPFWPPPPGWRPGDAPAE